MAQCKDCIHGEVCDIFVHTRTLICNDKADKMCKMFKSIADVVPKSEIITCKDCINCDHCYPAKAIGEEAAEGWYCISHKRYVKPDDFCSFAELKKKYTEDKE